MLLRRGNNAEERHIISALCLCWGYNLLHYESGPDQHMYKTGEKGQEYSVVVLAKWLAVDLCV